MIFSFSDLLRMPVTSRNPFVSQPTRAPTTFREPLSLTKLFHSLLNPRGTTVVGGLVLLNQIEMKLARHSKIMTRFKNLDQQILSLKQGLEDGSINQARLDHLYHSLKNTFESITFIDSTEAWVQRADLLDGIDALIKLCPDHYSPLVVKPDLNTPITPWKEATIPLVPYTHIQEVTHQIASERLKMENIGDVQRKLQGKVAGEYTGVAKTIRKVSQRGFKLARIMNFFYRILTKIAGLLYRNPPLFKNVMTKIADISREVGIKSFEILYKKTVDNDRGVFYYRGPKYLFGQSVHDYQSVNDWFKRDLTPTAHQDYLTKMRDEKSSLESRFGSLEGSCPLVISNSDARLRFSRLQPGQFGVSQELTGKVLSDESTLEAKNKNDDALYYAEKYKFTTKNLLGRESTDSMQPRDLVDVSTFKQRACALKQLRDQSQINKTKDLLLKDEKNHALIKSAQHELLSGIYRAFEQEGAVQVVQRLAPADVHNYVAPLDGKPLSHKEAVDLLRSRLESKKERLRELNEEGNKDKISELQTEIRHFQKLEEVFAAQEAILGRPSQATIDIHGTNESVSAIAIQNQSRILAQNDRKVMLFKQEDGSFSLHVFIGASGVNKVDVDPNTRFKRQGDRQGDMQFGADDYQANGEFLAAKDTMTRDGISKLKMGEALGTFPINGSTVISYYLPSDFSIKPEIEAFKQHAVYGEGLNRTEIEILSNMGDPILIKTEILLATVLEKVLGEEFVPFAGAETILKKVELVSVEKIETLSAEEKELLGQIRQLAREEFKLKDSELKLKKNLITLVNKRIRQRNRVSS